MNSPKPKRVVSKAEYARYLRKRYGILMRYSLAVLALAGVLYLGAPYISHRWYGGGMIAAIVALIIIGDQLSKRTQARLQQLEPVEPASRHNIDRLLPADVLVRGSDAPQTPEAVLLRAAEEQETPQEQLLRAAE